MFNRVFVGLVPIYVVPLGTWDSNRGVPSRGIGDITSHFSPWLGQMQEIFWRAGLAAIRSYTRHVTSAAPKRIGLLGGTFDPPHLGHLAMAKAVQTQVGLDEIIFLVANDPWQKSDDRSVTPAAIRLEMTTSLVAGESGMKVDDREIARGGPTYTVDTLTEIRSETPDAELFLIVGADTASRIPTWHRPNDMAAFSTLVVVNRSHEPELDESLLPAMNVIHVAMDAVDVSSTSIRQAIASGDTTIFGVTPAVQSVIDAHHLYVGAL